MTDGNDPEAASIRLDRWLHHARLFRTRSVAAAAVSDGGIRVNGKPCRKPAQMLRGGDLVTVSAHGQVRVLRVLGFAERRGPASAAAVLYEEVEM